MSRSLWALTRQHAPAGADRPGRTERGSCSLTVVASSARQYLLMVLMMAGLVGLAVVPCSALAAGGSHADHAAAGALRRRRGRTDHGVGVRFGVWESVGFAAGPCFAASSGARGFCAGSV